MKLQPSDKIHRIEEVLGIRPADGGAALMLHVDSSEGPLNLEMGGESLRLFISAVLQGLVGCSLLRDEMPSMADCDPAKSVYLPCSDVQVLPVAGAYRRLVFRVGIMDFSLMVATPQVAAGLVWALQSDPPPSTPEGAGDR